MFPTVATVYGLGCQGNSGLVATLALDQPMLSAPQPPPPPPPTQTQTSNSSHNTHHNQKPIHAMLCNIRTSDPITKALIDNVTGKLPTKKKPVMCDVCNIELSGPPVLAEHINGAKHKRMLALKEKSTNVTPLDPEKLNASVIAVNENNPLNPSKGLQYFVCELCNVKVNSADQMTNHIVGKAHKKKVNSSGGKPPESNFTGNSTTIPESNITDTKTAETKISKNSSVPPTSKVVEPPAPPIELPEGVERKTMDKMEVFSCKYCKKWVNSMDQMHLHLQSKKHKNKVNPPQNNEKKSRWRPYPKSKIVNKFRQFTPGGILGSDNRANFPTSYPKYDPNKKTFGTNGFNASCTPLSRTQTEKSWNLDKKNSNNVNKSRINKSEGSSWPSGNTSTRTAPTSYAEYYIKKNNPTAVKNDKKHFTTSSSSGKYTSWSTNKDDSTNIWKYSTGVKNNWESSLTTSGTEAKNWSDTTNNSNRWNTSSTTSTNLNTIIDRNGQPSTEKINWTTSSSRTNSWNYETNSWNTSLNNWNNYSNAMNGWNTSTNTTNSYNTSSTANSWNTTSSTTSSWNTPASTTNSWNDQSTAWKSSTNSYDQKTRSSTNSSYGHSSSSNKKRDFSSLY